MSLFAISILCLLWFVTILFAIFVGLLFGVAIYRAGCLDERKIWEKAQVAEALSDSPLFTPENFPGLFIPGDNSND